MSEDDIGIFGDAHDMHFYVFSYLSLADLKEVSLVCKAWNSTCNNRILWKSRFLSDVLFDATSSFGEGKTVDWKQLYKFCFTFPHFAKEIFKFQIASGAMRKYGMLGFVYQMGWYKDVQLNVAVSHIITKYLTTCVVEDMRSLLKMKEAIAKYCLPCVCIEVLQNFPQETLHPFEIGGACNCLGNAVNAMICPPEFDYLRVPLFSHLMGGNVVVFESDTVVSDIQPEDEVRYVSRSQIFSRYSFVSVPRVLDCVLGFGKETSARYKRKYQKISHNDNNTISDNNNNINNINNENNLPSSFVSSPYLSPPDNILCNNVDSEVLLDMFNVDYVSEFLQSAIIHRMAPRVSILYKEWDKEDLLEVRQKLDPFIPNFVIGTREDIFSIKTTLNLEGTAFPTPEKLKEAIFELSPIGSIVKPKMIFVRQMEFTDMVKAALPKKYRNTMYCFLQNSPVNTVTLDPGERTLQELIDINQHFSELSVAFYLRNTLLCDTLEEGLDLISFSKIMKLRRKAMFCAKDGFVIERDGIIKMATAARDIPPCGILFRKRKASVDSE